MTLPVSGDINVVLFFNDVFRYGQAKERLGLSEGNIVYSEEIGQCQAVQIERQRWTNRESPAVEGQIEMDKFQYSVKTGTNGLHITRRRGREQTECGDIRHTTACFLQTPLLLFQYKIVSLFCTVSSLGIK